VSHPKSFFSGLLLEVSFTPSGGIWKENKVAFLKPNVMFRNRIASHYPDNKSRFSLIDFASPLLYEKTCGIRLNVFSSALWETKIYFVK